MAGTLHIWVTLGFILLAIVLFAWEKLSTEVSALLILCGLLLFFHFMPLEGAVLDTERLLRGFANPALVAVLGLLVIGEALVQTDALNAVGRWAETIGGRNAWLTLSVVLLGITALSAWVNNTPLVIIFIPILQAIAARVRVPASQVMMPLSFVSILGGMTTLIGSSTNLLVSSSLIGLGREPLTMFEVTPVGLPVALAGVAYILLFARRLLPDRGRIANPLTGDGKQFIAQLTVGAGSRLIGERPISGMLRSLPDLVIKLLQRGEHAYAFPLDDIAIEPGDLLVVAGTRATITDALARDPALIAGDVRGDGAGEKRPGGQMMIEVMVPPRSAIIGGSLEQINFRHRTHCIVVGLRRRAQMITQRMTEMHLLAGDVLLVQGLPKDIRALRQRHEVVVVEGTLGDLRQPHSFRAAGIFAVVVLSAATGLVPITIAALVGAAAMVATGTLQMRQAARAIDRRIIMLVGTGLALGEALEATGAAAFLAHTMVGALEGASPAVVLVAFAAVVMLLTNLLTNNACAVLFTPIGVGVADRLGIDPHIFAIAVLIASDGCFATPIGYQTNLLVMGPGNYSFADYLRFGLPLSLIVLLVFAITAPWYFGL